MFTGIWHTISILLNIGDITAWERRAYTPGAQEEEGECQYRKKSDSKFGLLADFVVAITSVFSTSVFSLAIKSIYFDKKIQ